MVSFDVRRRQVAGILYRRPSLHDLWYVSLAPDNSGRYLILNEGLGTVFGWLHNGRWHPFAHHDVIVSSAAW